MASHSMITWIAPKEFHVHKNTLLAKYYDLNASNWSGLEKKGLENIDSKTWQRNELDMMINSRLNPY